MNGAALIAAAYLFSGFEISGGFIGLGWLALTLTALNYVVKPIIKLLLGPIIVLTLGLGLILVNAFILYLLDFFSPYLTIQNLFALLYASLLIGAANFIFHAATKNN